MFDGSSHSHYSPESQNGDEASRQLDFSRDRGKASRQLDFSRDRDSSSTSMSFYAPDTQPYSPQLPLGGASDTDSPQEGATPSPPWFRRALHFKGAYLPRVRLTGLPQSEPHSQLYSSTVGEQSTSIGQRDTSFSRIVKKPKKSRLSFSPRSYDGSRSSSSEKEIIYTLPEPSTPPSRGASSSPDIHLDRGTSAYYSVQNRMARERQRQGATDEYGLIRYIIGGGLRPKPPPSYHPDNMF